MLPAACLSALLCPLVVWPFASPFEVGMGDMLNLFLFGTTQFGLGLVFLTMGGRLVSATENALLNTLETPLAVAWVWLCFGETPPGPVLSVALSSWRPLLGRFGTADGRRAGSRRRPPDASSGAMLSALRHRNFRRYFIAQVVSNIGTWIQITVNWLVLQLSHSGLALGITNALQFGPSLLLALRRCHRRSPRSPATC